VKREIIDNLQSNFRGDIITPSDAGYDDTRQLYNAMIDKRPALIARCVNVADVITAVKFGTDNSLLIAIRGGGHNGPGFGSCDDGLVIDLSMMKGVRVNPGDSTVQVEPGCTQGDVDHATHVFGLAVPAGIVGTTGIAGLTLGGGTGYLTRKYGMTIDNLIEADVVLADGSFVTANETSNADLFWALRGGGGNFGIVTSFIFKTHPVKMVFAGPVFWDIAEAREVMQTYRDWLPTAPEELGAFLGVKTVPSTAPFPEEHWGKKVCAVISSYNGTAVDGEAAIGTLIKKLPEPLFNWMGEMPFPAIQGLFDGLLPKGLQWYWKGDFVKELSDDAIDEHIRQIKNAPSELSLMHLYPIDGAVHRVAPNGTAWGARDAQFSMVIAAIDADPAKADALKEWGRNYWNAVHKYNMPGAYVNFMMDDEDSGRVQASYDANYTRLAKVKKKYDPANVFRVNQNIEPAA
jgi:FAD/FMN-containing dehydrogenase